MWYRVLFDKRAQRTNLKAEDDPAYEPGIYTDGSDWMTCFSRRYIVWARTDNLRTMSSISV